MRRRQANAVGASAPPLPPVATEGRNYADMPDAELFAAYRTTFGKPPHHRMKRETIVERLNDLSDGRA